MLPIRDNVPSRKHPVAMWCIILANVCVFIFQIALPERRLERWVYLFGIVPRRYTRPGRASWVGFPADDYRPFLTSLFIHGGWFHILTNMWTFPPPLLETGSSDNISL